MPRGAYCGSDGSNLTRELGAEARRILREDFLFVGLSTPYFSHSQKLFHATFAHEYGCQLQSKGEALHIRGSTTSPDDRAEALAAIVSFTGGDLDKLVYYDRLLYEEAQNIFWPKYDVYFKDRPVPGGVEFQKHATHAP
jgi:hypothetical protein